MQLYCWVQAAGMNTYTQDWKYNLPSRNLYRQVKTSLSWSIPRSLDCLCCRVGWKASRKSVLFHDRGLSLRKFTQVLSICRLVTCCFKKQKQTLLISLVHHCSHWAAKQSCISGSWLQFWSNKHPPLPPPPASNPPSGIKNKAAIRPECAMFSFSISFLLLLLWYSLQLR